MIKLGIYGDSFADDDHGHQGFANLNNKAWFHLLSDYKITSYGKAGSSLYYSYKEFLQTNHLHDQIIFIITSPSRWPIPYTIPYKGNGNMKLHIVSPNTLLTLCKSSTDRAFRRKIQALSSFFTHLSSDLEPYEIDMRHLMINEIKRIRPDTIFVSFDQMVEYVKGFWSIVGRDADNKQEIRCICHVSEEINVHIAKDATNALKTGTWTVTDLGDIQHRPIDYYYDLDKSQLRL